MTLLTLERECFVREISNSPGQINSSPPIALEGRLRNGGRYDKRTKTANHKITTGRIRICYHRFLSGPDEKPSVRLLPQEQSDRHQSGCAYRGKAGTELLPQLWQTSDADTGPKACEILLRCLPHPLVEHPSGQGQPQSLLFLYLRLLREAIHSLWK